MMVRSLVVAAALLAHCSVNCQSAARDQWQFEEAGGRILRGTFTDADDLFDQTRWFESGTLTVQYGTGAKTICALKRADGVKHESCKSWYANGTLKTEYALADSVHHGPYSYWREDGRLNERGTFEQGKKNGPWAEWNPYCKKQVENTYRSGEPWEGHFIRPADGGYRLLVYRQGEQVVSEPFDLEKATAVNGGASIPPCK